MHPTDNSTKTMKTSRFLCLAAVLISTLTGCASKSVPKDFSLDAAKNEGIVIVSASHDLSGGRAARAAFYLNGGPMEEHGGLLSSLPDIFPGIPGGSDLEDGYGKVFALSLPAGQHKITSWQITNGSGLRIFPREKPAPLDFHVAAGEVKYLGNLHAILQTGKNLFGITVVGNGYPEVRDEQERDIAVFKEKYPQLKNGIVVDLLSLGPWITGAENRRHVDSPPLLPSPPVKR